MFSAAWPYSYADGQGPVAAAELTLHRRDVDDVGAPGRRGGYRWPQAADEYEGCCRVGQLNLEQFEGIDVLDLLGPAVVGLKVG